VRLCAWCLLLVASSIGCARPAAPEDPAFEARWRAAAARTQALTVGEGGSEALADNVRRVRPRLDPAPGAQPAGLPEQPAGDDVDRIIRSNLGAVKGCYLAVAAHGSGRSGKAIVSFTIGSDGRAGNVQVDAPSFQGTPLGTCLSSQVAFWSFPRSVKGGGAVSYPFVFVGG
jgi:hypothetical protein